MFVLKDLRKRRTEEKQRSDGCTKVVLGSRSDQRTALLMASLKLGLTWANGLEEAIETMSTCRKTLGRDVTDVKSRA